jgi:ribosome-binding protein aMBF1 (putative translation factor)
MRFQGLKMPARRVGKTKGLVGSRGMDLSSASAAALSAIVLGSRAVLGWGQRDLAARLSMTQKSVYRMEQGTHDLRRSTVVMVEQVLKAEGIEFEETPGGGFKVVVGETVVSKLDRATRTS